VRPHEIALEYLDTPFRHRGRTKNGLDCVGLLVMVAHDLGMEVEDLRVYGREPVDRMLREYLRRNLGDPVDRPIQPDDVITLSLGGREESHVAIVAPHPHGLGMIHTYGEVGRVVFHRIDSTRRNQIVEVFQWPAKH
jgi:hypothetical protein